jgi:hypothetical protein
MKIFISYSTPDLYIVKQLAVQLQLFGEVYYWAESKQPGQDAWQSIFNWIDTADLVVVLITGNTLTRAMPVGQEIGRAKSRGKTIIPIISRNISSDELGFLNGVTYQPIDVFNPHPAIEDIIRVVNAYYFNNQEKQKIAIGLVALGILFWLGTSK